jgi:predicted nucleic acid-binding protein
MTVQCFLDTNILIYAAVGKEDDPEKYARAIELIAEAEFGISAQVLQEFYTNVVRKPRKPLSPYDALAWIEQLEVFPCADITFGLVKIAAELSQRFRISYWDAAIVAAAEQLGADILYTEDLNHGQVYGTVRVENPFLSV